MTLPAQARRPAERGGSRFNLIVILLVIALASYSAYNYVPVAYNSYRYKDFMQETLNKAAYPPAKSPDWVAQQLRAATEEYNLPADTDVRVQNDNGRFSARVTFTHPVQLPGYTYEYNFDHTARSSGFIGK